MATNISILGWVLQRGECFCWRKRLLRLLLLWVLRGIFSYSGYARITTMGEEVRKPQQTIPKAIIFTLVLTMLLYVAVAVVFVGVGGVDKLSLETTGNTAPWVGINCRRFNLAGDRPTASEKLTL